MKDSAPCSKTDCLIYGKYLSIIYVTETGQELTIGEKKTQKKKQLNTMI